MAVIQWGKKRGRGQVEMDSLESPRRKPEDYRKGLEMLGTLDKSS